MTLAPPEKPQVSKEEDVINRHAAKLMICDETKWQDRGKNSVIEVVDPALVRAIRSEIVKKVNGALPSEEAAGDRTLVSVKTNILLAARAALCREIQK